MASRTRHLLFASVVAIPAIAYTGPCFGHNGRDTGPAKPRLEAKAKPEAVDPLDCIKVTNDKRTGVRSYEQVCDIPSDEKPKLAKAEAEASASTGPGIEYWVEKSFAQGYAPIPRAAPVESSYAAPAAGTQVYDEGYYYGGYAYGYGGYYPAYAYGGGGGRHGRRGHGGHDGDGRPGRPGDGGGSSSGGPGYRLPPGSRWSPPPGPEGGGVGSPPPYFDAGVGAPNPPLRYNSFGLRGGRR